MESRNTKVLVDTNVILDVMMNRTLHYEDSSAFLKLCSSQISGMITATQTKDIYYLLETAGKKSASESKTFIRKLTDNIKVIDVNSSDVNFAFDSEMEDYEDALIAYCGKRQKADYIVTRNETDFVKSPVPALSPQAFLEKFF
jgi:predicted nucleic acid-binding protein